MILGPAIKRKRNKDCADRERVSAGKAPALVHGHSRLLISSSPHGGTHTQNKDTATMMVKEIRRVAQGGCHFV